MMPRALSEMRSGLLPTSMLGLVHVGGSWLVPACMLRKVHLGRSYLTKSYIAGEGRSF